MSKNDENQQQKKIDLYALPDGWTWETVYSVGGGKKNAIVDGPFGSNLKVSDYVESGPIPVLTTKNLEGNYSRVRYITAEKFEELKRSAVNPNDILMAKIGSCGKLGIYPANATQAMIPANLLKVSVADGYNLKYVYYFFSSPFFKRSLETIIKATAQPAFGVTDFKRLPFPRAPLQVQAGIVAEIEKQFSRLDEAVGSLKRIQSNLKRYKAAVLKAAVEGKLTEQWRKDHPAVEPADQLLKRILAERRAKWEAEEQAKIKVKGIKPKDESWKKKYKEPAGPDTANLPELPEGWVWATYAQTGTLNLGRQRAPKYHTGSNMRQYLRVQNVFEDRIDLSDVMEMDFPPADFEKYELKSGDMLLNEGQSPELLGRPAIYRGELPGACFTNTLIRFRAVTGVSVEFALLVSRYYMRARRFLEEGSITTNIAHLSLGRLATIEFPLPCFAEQQTIVAEAERLISVTEELEVTIKTNLKRAERLRQTILQKAFLGGIVS